MNNQGECKTCTICKVEKKVEEFYTSTIMGVRQYSETYKNATA